MNAFNELLSAIEQKNLKMVKCLLKAQPFLFHVECPQGWPAVHRCIDDPVNESCLDLDMAKQYVAHGGDVNKKAGGGVSLLFLAAMHFESKPIADYLVACGAQMSTFEQAVLALFRGENKSLAKRTIVRLVDKDPCLIRQADYQGYTLLHHAVRHYHYRLVPYLLEQGADINAQTHDGKTSLSLCGFESTTSAGAACRKLLIERGAKFSANEELAELIYVGKDDEAIERFELHPEVRNAWVSYGSGASFLHVAAWLGKTARIVEYLLSHGVDSNTQDNEGRTPLFRVANRVVARWPGSLAIIRSLVQHGAEINHRDDDGCTPLHAMAAHTNEEPLRLLVELGADLNIEANDGQTPLDIVYDRGYLGYRSLAHWMKKQGARAGTEKKTAR